MKVKYMVLSVIKSLVINLCYKKILAPDALNNTAYDRKSVLICYIIHPFFKKNRNHPNAIELSLIVNLFNSLGYQITVVDYRRKKIFGNYDLCFGFGDAFEYVINNNLSKKSILYSTGSPSFYQNSNSILAYKRFLNRDDSDKYINAAKYLRLTENTWPLQLVKSDAIVTIGNKYIENLFSIYNKVYTIPSVFFKTVDYKCIIENRNYENSKRKFIWFGGKGVLHKGLDLCIEAFKYINAELYIVGNIDDEINIFSGDISNFNNIKYVGFVDVNSESFRDLLLMCSFSILPSCSESMATSVITLAGNGGVIPLITKECGFDFSSDLIEISSLNLNSVKESINHALSLTESQIKNMSYGIARYANDNHTEEKFSEMLRYAVKEIGGHNDIY